MKNQSALITGRREFARKSLVEGADGSARLCVALVGGMDRLKRKYESAAQKCGVELKVFTGKESGLAAKIGEPDLAILVTGLISHSAEIMVTQHSRSLGIPVHFMHSNGISGLRRSLLSIVSRLEKPEKRVGFTPASSKSGTKPA
ncbi:MAG: DUF2325 domain-containing protein [Deltaproteobacteria bacterium]|jgi:hypothetical protein|nr:DUF2325 domain-containing protein [Deltaproteobacteria bacterium]